MHPIYYGHQSSISETLDIVERGFERFGIPLQGITRLSRIAPKLTDQKQHRPITTEMVLKMIDMTHAGYSQAEIADAVGCSQSAVSKRLTRMMITGGKTQRQHGYQRSASA